MNYASSAFDRRDVIDFNPFHSSATARATPASLSVMERSVISLSLQDSERTIGEAPTWRRLLARVFGHKLPNKLANEPLEELRRFAILTRLRGEVDDDTLDRFLDAGYTVEQADLVAHFIGRHTPKRQPIANVIVAWLLIAAAAVGVYLLMQAAVEEPAISLIITGVAFVTFASLAAPRDHRMR